MALVDQEPYVRMAVSGINTALDYTGRLDPTPYDASLERFRHHANEALHQLKSWASANEIEVRQGMHT